MMKKRLMALLVAGVIGVTSLTGCSGSISDSEVVATFGDIEVPAKLYNFFARYMQAEYETYYSAYLGENMWTTEAEEGVTYEASVKSSMIENVEVMLLLEQHAEEYGCTLTDAEKEVVADLAAKFIESNDSETLKIIDADLATAERALELVAIQNKMVEKIQSEADTKVSDEVAAQKSLQYVSFSLSTTDDEGNSVDMTDEEKAEVEKQAEELIAGAKESGDFQAYAEGLGYNVVDKSFDLEDTAPIAEVITTAYQMKEGEISDVIKGDSAYYVVKLVSEFDKEATEAEKESIISERKSEVYSAKIEEWKGDTESVVNEEVLAKISFQDPSVQLKMEETETEAEEAAE